MSSDSYYNSRYIFDERRAIVWKEIVRFLNKFISKDSTVVDLGAGYCDFINNVNAIKKYAIDISPELRNFANDDVIQINKTGWNFNQIPDYSIDVIHASNFLEHFSDNDLEKIFVEIKRILRPNGKLILMQPNYRLSYKNYFDDPTHKKVFSDSTLESFLISQNFKIILKMPRFLPFSMRSNSSLIPKWLLPIIVRLYIYSPLKLFAGQMLFIGER